MSLLTWLPFINDTKNQGLSGEIITPAFTQDSNGKLGKCYHSSSTTSATLGQDINLANTSNISMGGWFKFNKAEIETVVNSTTYTSSANAMVGTILGYAPNTGGGLGIIWRTNNIYTYGELKYIALYSILRTSTAGAVTTTLCQIEFDVWYNAYFVFDRNANKTYFYLNGELAQQGTVPTSFSDMRDGAININASGVPHGPYRTSRIPFYMNDIRIYDNALSPLEVKELAQGLILHYPLDNINCIDTSGYGRNGTAIGSTIVTSSDTPRYNNCLYFSGDIDRVALANTIDLDYPLTVTLWLNGSNVLDTATHYVFSYDTSNGGLTFNEIGIVFYKGKLGIVHGGTTIPVQALTNNTWYFVAAVVTPTDYKLYLDGEVISQGSATHSNLDSKYVTIASRANSITGGIGNGYGYFNGYLSDVRFYATALSEADIINLYKTSARIDNLGNLHEYEVNELSSPNLVTGLTAGGRTTVVDDGRSIQTTGVNADTYFNISLSESIVAGTTYTLSCVGSNLPADGTWRFGIGGDRNTVNYMDIRNGYNEVKFTAADISWGSNQILMDDRSPVARANVCKFSNFRLFKNDTSKVEVNKDGTINASQFVEGSDKTRFFSGGTAYINEIKEV